MRQEAGTRKEPDPGALTSVQELADAKARTSLDERLLARRWRRRDGNFLSSS